MTAQTNAGTFRFILIDSNSGYIWGEAQAASPLDAVQIVDQDLGAPSRRYQQHGPFARVDESHYIVFVAPEGFREITDGQSEEQIEAVGSLAVVAQVEWAEG